MEEFYTYIWLREDGTPYYVGKGKGYRAYIFHRHQHGLNPPLEKDRIIVQYFGNESDALEAERFLILLYGQKHLGTGCLRNLSEGGIGGFSGGHHTAEAKEKIAKASTGRKKSPEAIEKCRLVNLGRKATAETLIKMREAKLGKSAWWYKGVPKPEEVKLKISNNLMGRVFPGRYYNHKLTNDQCAEIIRLKSEGLAQSVIASMFSINQCHVSRIISGKRRPNVPTR